MRPDDLAAAALRGVLADAALDPARLDDVIIGCAFPEAEQGMNLARIAALRAGIPAQVPAMTINRFCSSGLQAIALAAQRIAAGQADCIIAGGTESMSLIPMGGNKFIANPRLVAEWPETMRAWALPRRTWPLPAASAGRSRTDDGWRGGGMGAAGIFELV